MELHRPRTLVPPSFFLAGLLAGLPALQATSVRAAPLRVIYGAVSASNTPLWVADGKELYRRYGLDMQLSHIATTQAVQALLSGDIQFTTSSAQIVYSDLQGRNAVYIAGLTNHFVFYLGGHKTIRNVGDLKGTTIASTQPDEPTTISVRMALRRGVMKAAVMSPPLSLAARELGFHPVIAIAATEIPFIHTGIAARRSYLRSHPETARDFLKAIVAALKTCRERPGETEAIMAKYKSNLLKEAYRGFQPTREKIPYVSRRGVETIIEGSRNPKARTAGPEEFMDNSLLKELEASGSVEAQYAKKQ